MFSKSKTPTGGSSEKPTKPAPPSIISIDLKITGDLHCAGEIQIDGTVEGDIRTKSLLVGHSAKIKGEIIAETVRVHGSVNGQIKAKVVNLAKTAHVVGDILHEDLSIETGAFLEGHCKRIPPQQDLQEPSKIEILNSGKPEGVDNPKPVEVKTHKSAS